MRNRDEMHDRVVARAQAILRRRRWWRTSAAVACLVAVGALGLGLQALDDGEGNDQIVTIDEPNDSTTTSSPIATTTSTTTTSRPPTTSGLPALYPSYLPNGVQDVRLSVQRNPVTSSVTGHVQTYYGARVSETALVQLLVQDEPLFGTEQTPEMLAGRDVLVSRDGDLTAVTTTVDDREVTLVGYHLSDDELSATIEAMHRRPDGRGWAFEALPAGLTLVAEGDIPATPLEYAVHAGEGGEAPVSISVRRGTLLPEDTCVCNPGMRQSIELTSVHGAPAVLIDFSPTGPVTPAFSLQWQYAPDVVVRVFGLGLTVEETLRVTEGIGEADPTTWSQLPCTISDGRAGPPPSCSAQDEIPAR